MRKWRHGERPCKEPTFLTENKTEFRWAEELGWENGEKPIEGEKLKMEGERERDAFLVAAIFSANKSNNITRPSFCQ